MHSRQGFIFLYVLGLLSVTLAIAFALLASAQTAHSSSAKIEMDLLANQAAREGVQHATSVICKAFATGPAVPTQLSDAWRNDFWPIDTTKVGIATITVNDDAPTGSEFTPEDLYENDVHVENTLIEAYRELDTQKGIYQRRSASYHEGWYNHPGLARWFEPGVRMADPAVPISFHLDHPVPANGGMADDPAALTGENYLPDIDEPIWYDSELIATTDRAKRRYRLRYAVAVEDLGGHLLVTTPGEFDTSAVSVLTGSPTDADRYKINEVDNAVADVYAGALSNMYRYTGYRVWEWADIGLRGLGATDLQMGYQMGFNEGTILASRDGSGKMTYFDDCLGGSQGPYYLPIAGTDFRMNHESVMGGGSAHYVGVGPIPSFLAIWQDASNVNWNHRPYLFTPFGRAPRKTNAAPVAWNESRVDAPWQINLPTMVPRALMTMVYAYVPGEFKTQGSDQQETTFWNDVQKFFPSNPKTIDAATSGSSAIPAKFSHQNGAVELFTDMASLAHFDQNGGVVPGDPYPGIRPGAPGGHWLPNLGKEILTNQGLGLAGMSALNGTQSYPTFGFSDVGIVSQRSVGGINTTMIAGLMRPDNNGVMTLRSYSSGFTAEAGFYYHESYWLDLTVAMMHSVAVARYAWLDRVNGAHQSDPLSGKPRWPAALPADYFPLATAPGWIPGTLTRDRDVDGNGTQDVPSTFDTIAEVDQQFLRNLGEWPEDYALGSRPVAANRALRMTTDTEGSRRDPPGLACIDLDGLGSKTIKRLRTDGTITSQQSALMELVVNDMRMSFFGASPDYPDFRPLDLDDDGSVSCSGYTTGKASADTTTGRGPQPDTWFSLTGCFVLEKSRYYRIFTRGQLFDEIRGVPVAETNLETVYAVDPDGDLRDVTDSPGIVANGLADSHVLYQRRLQNHYRGILSHVAE